MILDILSDILCIHEGNHQRRMGQNLFFCQNGEEPVSFEKFHRCRLEAMAPIVYIIGLPNNMLHAVEMSTTIKEKLAGPNP